MPARNHKIDATVVAEEPTMDNSVKLEVVPSLPKQLDEQEAKLFEECEATLQRAKRIDYDSGMALRTIRDQQLYRESHSTFEAYVSERLGCSRGRAYQLIDQAEVSQRLSNALDIKIALSHRQAQLLKPVGADKVAELWKNALEMSGNGDATTKALKAAVKAYRQEYGLESPTTARQPSPKVPEFEPDHAKQLLEQAVMNQLHTWPEDQLETGLAFLGSLVLKLADGKRG